MISSYDYYKQIESPNMYLCNPDKRFICALNGEGRHLVLRFNDLSELTFTVPKIKGSEVYYNLIESKRLIFIEKIGWFQISGVSETTEGDKSSKEVTAQSHQYAFKDRGFVTEDRVYMFYNPNDPDDSEYNQLAEESFASAEAKAEFNKAIPSVVGQLQQQLGIKVQLNDIDFEPTEDYGEWTIIYIDPILEFSSKSDGEMYVAAENAQNICRGFEANTSSLNAYDFMVNKVENAFEVIFEFDFLHHAIKVKTLEDVTQPTNIYLAFDNLINSLNVTENAEDIVTVMTCEGSDIDIRTVNPMGNNYIVNFDYYKKRKSDDGSIDYPWMSKELIDALDDWEKEFEQWQQDDELRVGLTKSYGSLTKDLQEVFVRKTQFDADIQYANLKLSDMRVARDQNPDNNGDIAGYITAESVNIGGRSLLATSKFYKQDLADSATVVGHTSAPKPTKQNDGTYKFLFEGGDSGTQRTLKQLIENYIDTKPQDDAVAVSWYFIDDADSKSFCKLKIASEVGIAKDPNGNIASSGTVEVRGVTFEVVNINGEFGITFPNGTNTLLSQSNSYFTYDGTRYRIIASADGIVSVYAFYVSGFERYTTNASMAGDRGWVSIWENHINNDLTPIGASIQKEIDAIEAEMQYVNQQCDVEQYIKRRGQKLYDELSYYWIEGEYTNDNIAAYDNTTMAERIDLAKDLMAAGKADLAKCAQPQFEMTVDALNFIKMYEFRQFTTEIALGKVVTIEKNDEVCYRPALMSLEYDLDKSDSFSMTFSNASKPGDTAMTFADLIKESSSTSRTVSANWSNLTDYSRNKETITNLILNPLDRTLRAAKVDMASQAFVIDDTGILGRKYDKDADGSNSLFLPEQVRIINNTILFTTDNWETSALALGKVKYGENGETAYGLVADVLVGNLVLGREMKIINENNTISIDKDGIIIKNDKEETFQATTDGDVYLKGEVHASKGTIGDLTINEDGSVASPYFKIDKFGGRIGGFEIAAKTLIGASVGMRSGEEDISTVSETEDDKDIVYAFWAGNDIPEEAPFRVTNSGFIAAIGTIEATDIGVSGELTASHGKLGQLRFDDVGIRSSEGKFSLTKDGEIIAQDIVTSSVGGISGAGKLDFTKAASTEQMYYDYSVNIGDKTSTITVTAKLSSSKAEHNLTAPKTFDFKITYWNGAFHCSRTASVTIKNGESSNSTSISTVITQTIKHKLRNANDVEAQTAKEWDQSTASAVKAITCEGNLIPKSSVFTLGTGAKPWKQIFATTNEIGSSDIKKKMSVEKLDSKYSELFDRLTPVSYMFKEGTSGRRHTGLIANEIKDSLRELGISTKDFAGYCEWEDDDGTLSCGLRYAEFIAININEIQMLKKRVSELEDIINNNQI